MPSDRFHQNTMVAPRIRKISQWALKKRWPRAKWKAMLAFMDTDTNDPATLAMILDLKDAFDSFKMAEYIDLDLQEFREIVASFTEQAVPAEMRLTAREATAILVDGTEDERAKGT